MDCSFTRKKKKCLEAISGITSLMRKNQIPLPSKYQKSRVHEDLPDDPGCKEDEVLRRFRYLEPASRGQIAEKLNDLLVYAEVAKALRSEIIAIIVLSKLSKWENLLLDPALEMPPIPPPSPEKRTRLIQRKQNIEERDRRTADVLRQYEEQGENRRAALQRINPFEENIRTTTLPPQTIPSPDSQIQGATARVDVEEQRRRDMEKYQKFGAVRKRLYDNPDYQRDLTGPKLPSQTVPSTSQDVETVDIQHLYKDLGRQREVDKLKQQLHDAFPSRRRSASNYQTHSLSPEGSRHPQQSIEERKRRAANDIKQYEEIGQTRRAAVEGMDPLQAKVRTITLPSRTVTSTYHSQMQEQGGTAVRVEGQRRRDVRDFENVGAIKKRFHGLPAHQRDIKGPKLPPHELPQRKSRHRYKVLEEQRERDNLIRQLQEAVVSHRRIHSNDPESFTGNSDNIAGNGPGLQSQ